MKLRYRTVSGYQPRYQTEGSSGFDVQAYLPDRDIRIGPGERSLIPTGLYFEIPFGYELQVRARSGLALRYGIDLANGIGTIDSDYRGELSVILRNGGEEDFVVRDGDRIAQCVLCPVSQAQLVSAEDLTETDRGEGAFGHTGLR